MNVILGDNPFFDINHKTGGTDRGFQQQVMEEVVAEFERQRGGVFLLSDHLDFRTPIIKMLAGLSGDNLSVALISPVPHTINAVVANGGYKALLRMINVTSVLFFGLALIAKLGRNSNLFRYFLEKAIIRFIKKQLQKYVNAGVAVSHFGMHNVFTDMLLASKNIEILNAFITAVRALKMAPVLLTQNTAPLLALDGLASCAICGSINPNGYMMSPSQNETELAVLTRSKQHEIWAMQILAGGSCDFNTSLEYLKKLKINSFVYATSKRRRIVEVFDNI